MEKKLHQHYIVHSHLLDYLLSSPGSEVPDVVEMPSAEQVSGEFAESGRGNGRAQLRALTLGGAV